MFVDTIHDVQVYLTLYFDSFLSFNLLYLLNQMKMPLIYTKNTTCKQQLR